ncbi:MAG: hypothetical protein IIV65_04370 [Alistipes sp.]|nr:hypothetical protein [Alistipes sp.]
MKIVFAILLALVVFVAFIAVKAWWSNRQPLVAEGYYQATVSGGELERRYTERGEYEISKLAFDVADDTMRSIYVWMPQSEAPSPRPIIIIVNGSNAIASRCEPFFERLASWGFVVVGNDDPMAGRGDSTSRTLDFLLAAADDDEHPLYGLIDISKIGIAGYSQGGAGALRAATEFANSSRYTTLFTCSAASQLLSQNLGWAYDPAKVQIPYFMVAGTGVSDAGDGKDGWVGVTPLASLEENYAVVPEGVERVMARRVNAEHEDMMACSDAYLTAWMLYRLYGDEQAAQVFVGDTAEIRHNGLWQDVKSNMWE